MMKKVLIALMLVVLIPTVALAWDDCPNGQTEDCAYPGECGRYVDTDDDQICDHSQSAPEDRNVASPTVDDESVGGIESDSAKEDDSELGTNNVKTKTTYHFLPISLFLIILYLVTLVLSKKKIISVLSHKKVWNVLLLISFLISGILGVLLIIKINFDLTFSLPFNMLFWHVEIGIAMFIICIFHIIERFSYFKSLLKFKKSS